MSSVYKASENTCPHFVTSTVVGWVDALSREWYKEIICESLKHCIDKKGLLLHAWVIMPNHIHLIISCKNGYEIGAVMRDMKKYTAGAIMSAISENPQESRKNWMLNIFGFVGRTNSGQRAQFWQNEYHPIMLDEQYKYLQRLNYLHDNPVKAGIVWRAEDYKYSSASDYLTAQRGLLPITRID